MTTQDLLDAWRDATRAAELAESLAAAALRAAQVAEASASESEKIAGVAEAAARAAESAAFMAREAATRARELAVGARTIDWSAADDAVTQARQAEATAAQRYHRAEADGRDRHGIATSRHEAEGEPATL